jgi:hypothetical protein
MEQLVKMIPPTSATISQGYVSVAGSAKLFQVFIGPDWLLGEVERFPIRRIAGHPLDAHHGRAPVSSFAS